MRSVEPRPSFRDPAGSLTLEPDRAVRTIHPAARAATLEFVASPFYQRVLQRGDMVSTHVEEGDGELRLVHPRIPIPTYPWEWTVSQWRFAADLTLDLCEEALGEGWILKDATPLNILFVGSRPVLVDVLSFERRDVASSLWLAYGQYIRTFLLPLVMHRLLSWPLELSFFRRDGYEPAEAYRALSWSQRLSRTALWPISLPVWLEARRGASAAAGPVVQSKDPEISAHVLKRMLAGLRRRTRAAILAPAASQWAEYRGALTHYSSDEMRDKRSWVSAVLAELRPGRVLDVGANTGEFSELAALTGAEVVALERDAAAAEQLFLMSRARSLPIQTIHADLARPTAAAGWENGESTDLLSRLAGQMDMVMLLAVIHHLLLMEQIPLPAILSLCHRLTRHWLLVEWIPVNDPMFQSLMRGRDSIYGRLSAADLLAACAGRFAPVRQHTLHNGRMLFLFERE